MWIFLNDAFFSIVEDKDDINYLVVRARHKGDIEKVFAVSEKRVIVLPERDYRFRIVLERQMVAETIMQEVESIDYTNFKNSIAKDDNSRYKAYTGVWHEMFKWQMEEYPDSTGWWENYRSYY